MKYKRGWASSFESYFANSIKSGIVFNPGSYDIVKKKIKKNENTIKYQVLKTKKERNNTEKHWMFKQNKEFYQNQDVSSSTAFISHSCDSQR